MANLAYNYTGQRVTDERQDRMYVFGSSSAGNSIYFKHPRILIDLGFPYKRYTDYDPLFFLKVDYIMLTHEHSDHLNPSTLLRVIHNYPGLKVIVPPNMWNDMMKPDFAHRINQAKLNSYRSHFIFAHPMQLVNHKGMAINYIPHVTSHGPITNCAIELVYDNQHILYASDLDNFKPDPIKQTQGLPMNQSNPFDVICLEANYDPDLIKEYIETHDDDFRATENLRHTSEPVAWDYVHRYLKPDGIFIPLHASHMFGTLWQDYGGSYN